MLESKMKEPLKRCTALLLAVVLLAGCLGVSAFADEGEHEHDWQLTETLDPTCTEAGYQVYTCSGCEESDTQTLEALGHTPAKAVRENEIPATCAEDGSVDTVVYCAVCGAELRRETEALPAVPAVDDPAEGEAERQETEAASLPTESDPAPETIPAGEDGDGSVTSDASEAVSAADAAPTDGDAMPEEQAQDATSTSEPDESQPESDEMQNAAGERSKAPMRAPDVSGSCGTNATYTFDSATGVLTVTGTGDAATIWEDAFSGDTDIRKVTVTNIATIGHSAFAGCTGLQSVSLPNTLTGMGARVFQDCSSLTAITLPNSLTQIPEYTFLKCTSLTSVTLGNRVTSIGNSAFERCDMTGMDLVLPNTVTTIGIKAFRGTGLNSITVPASVTSIGDFAFAKQSLWSSETSSEINYPPVGTVYCLSGVNQTVRDTGYYSAGTAPTVYTVGPKSQKWSSYYTVTYVSEVQKGDGVSSLSVTPSAAADAVTMGGKTFYKRGTTVTLNLSASVSDPVYLANGAVLDVVNGACSYTVPDGDLSTVTVTAISATGKTNINDAVVVVGEATEAQPEPEVTAL